MGCQIHIVKYELQHVPRIEQVIIHNVIIWNHPIAEQFPWMKTLIENLHGKNNIIHRNQTVKIIETIQTNENIEEIYYNKDKEFKKGCAEGNLKLIKQMKNHD